MIPDKVKIGPVIYNVTEVDVDEPWGEVKYGECSITIKADLVKQQKIITLQHEICHAILIQAGYRTDAGNEGLIDALSHGLVSFRQDNPELWIRCAQ